MEMAEELAAHEIAALVANKALLREGWAQQITEVWDREQTAMKAIAEELGPIGWSDEHEEARREPSERPNFSRREPSGQSGRSAMKGQG